MKLKIQLALAVVGVLASCVAETVFVVDVQRGNDANPGTAAAPFATVLKARDAVRALKASGDFPNDGVAVELNGTFDWPAGEGLSLDEKDSGLSSSAPVTWRAGKGGAVFTGAYRLSAQDFAVVTDAVTLARLRPESRGKVYVCDLATRGVGELKPLPRQFTQWGEMELFAGGKDMTIARWPNTGWIQIPKVIDRGVKPIDHATGEWEHGYKGGVFTYEGDEPARWDVAKGVYMKGFWCHDWCSETLRVASIDTAKREITSEGIHTYGIGNSSKWHTAKRRYYVYNLLEELDAPGEWYVDRAERKLYFMPPNGRFDDVCLAVRKAPLIGAVRAKHVVLKGLQFRYTSGEAVSVNGADGLTLDGIEVRYVSQRAVSLWACRNCTVTGCRIFQIGGTGLMVDGGDRRSLTPGNNRVTKCDIHHCARLSRISGPCLTFTGCGNRIDHNAFHDTPYIAVTYGGNEHVFEYNDVACAMMESGDGGGVYTGRDWGSQGTIVRYNYFHHFGADGVAWRTSQGVAPEFEPLKESVMVMGLYLDDCDSGETVYGNIFYKAGWAMFCGGGRDNKWRENLCIGCTSAAQLDIRGLKRARPGEGTKDGWDLLKKLQDMDWQNDPWKSRYPWLVNVMENDPKLPIGTEFTGNVSIGCGEFFRMWGDTTKVLKERLVCRDNVQVGKTSKNEAAWFPQTNAAEVARLKLTTDVELERLADADPLHVQDTPVFKARFPSFPRIPVENIGLDNRESFALRARADRRIAEIRATPNRAVPAGAPTYYVSAKTGDDAADGRTPQTAWRTSARVGREPIAPGSFVLFERGGVYRGSVKVSSGVTYTAYGTGPKPCIYGSPENGADPSKWTQTDNPKVWAYDIGHRDVGTLVFDDGAAHAIKIVIRTDRKTGAKFNKYTGGKFDSYRDLDQDLHFWHDYYETGTGRLYLYSEQNPGARFRSIEFNVKCCGFGVGGACDVTIDNFTVKYVGVHGVAAGTCRNLSVGNCEFGWIGGSIQAEAIFGRDYPTRLGNAVEIYGGCDGYSVTNCYAWQVYDAGVTHQFNIPESAGLKRYDERNVRYADNVFEKCNYSIEYFLTAVNGNPSRMENLLFENNLMFDAGRGFCEQRPDRGEAAHIKAWYCPGRNRAKNYVIRNNAFCRSRDMIVQINSGLKNLDGSSSLPTLTDNVFIGAAGDTFGSISETSGKRLPYDADTQPFVDGFGTGNRCVVEPGM